jgi:endonuclease III
MKERLLLKAFRKTYSEELGIDLKRGKPAEIFKWFLASILFGKRIGEGIAKNTYREFEREGLLTPKKILDAGWDRLVEVLDRGGYVRYDFSTASNLLDIMKNLKLRYGSLEALKEAAKDQKDLEARLQQFKGIGPTTVSIFLRELRGLWRVDPRLSPFAELAARNLKIGLEKFNRRTERFARLECGLLRLGKNFCRKGKCDGCSFKKLCVKGKGG